MVVVVSVAAAVSHYRCVEAMILLMSLRETDTKYFVQGRIIMKLRVVGQGDDAWKERDGQSTSRR